MGLLPPETLYGKLFYDVQSNANIFSDSKTFVDCVPLKAPAVIRRRYSALQNKSDSSLRAFITAHFAVPESAPAYVADSLSMDEHILKLWRILKRPGDKSQRGTLIPLPHPYIVPGGRFREIYYWDSYFTMLGLQADSLVETIHHMVKNFSFLIEQFGFIPNGNRTYYLSRSQPPFFAMMVILLAESRGNQTYLQFRKALEKEYAFWMAGLEKLSGSQRTFRRLVKLPDGAVLNRYRDDRDAPRAESYQEDVKTADMAISINPAPKRKEVYRNLRSAAESGWDFSSRWLTTDSTGRFSLHTIRTTNIIPVDLNALLYNLEKTIAKACSLSGDVNRADAFRKKAGQRRLAIIRYCWDPDKGFFMDYNFQTQRRTGILSLAGVTPLFFQIASQSQAESVAKSIRQNFLKPGGVVTSLNHTGQQWDAPNGWPPLQWLTIKGLRNYCLDSLAATIKKRWLKLNRRVYANTFKMMEKYNVVDMSLPGGGGEYPTQDGFGWTNGLYRKLSVERVDSENPCAD
jgi:alpha,alpha-trehalase